MITHPKSLAELVDHQIKFWEERHGRRVDKNASGEGPWISVSRQVGAGGTELGYALGKRLVWSVFDRYFHDQLSVAEDTVLAAYSEMEERRYAGDQIVFAMLDEPTQFVYIHKMMRAVRDTAKKGKAVIIGRGAHCFLNPAAGLRVRVIAPLALRLNRLIEHENLAPEKAAECVRKSDEERRAFVKRVFNRDIDDPAAYDLVMNAEHFEPSAQIALVIKAMRAKLAQIPDFEKVLAEIG